MQVSQKWSVLGLFLVALLLLAAYNSHRRFKETLIRSVNVQRGVFAKSLANSITDHLFEEEQDLRHLMKEVEASGFDTERTTARMASLYETHLDDFESIFLFDDRGSLLSAVPEGAATKPMRNGGTTTILLEPSEDAKGQTLIPMILVSESGAYRLKGNLRIEEYMVGHFPSWQGESLSLVMADDDGVILSLLNSQHETDVRMKPGNILALGDSCLHCHDPQDFADVLVALKRMDIVHSTYKNPETGLVSSRTTIPFDLYNERWLISIITPFESIQTAIDNNFRDNAVLTILSFFILVVLSFFIFRLELYREQAKAAKNLRAYADQLVEANRMKDLFTDIIRHDLLNPVSAIKGYIQVLGREEQNPARRETFTAAEKAVTRLSDIIKGASKLSKYEGDYKIDAKRLDLGALLEQAAAGLKSSLDEKGIKVTFKGAERSFIVADPVISDVFVNLLSNAVKYSDDGRGVEVEVEDSGDNWIVRVKDWGPGISDEHKMLVFNRFERLGKKGIKGVGLGLAIVKRLVTIHGGTVAVEDNLDGGSVFIVKLPKASGSPGDSRL